MTEVFCLFYFALLFCSFPHFYYYYLIIHIHGYYVKIQHTNVTIKSGHYSGHPVVCVYGNVGAQNMIIANAVLW